MLFINNLKSIGKLQESQKGYAHKGVLKEIIPDQATRAIKTPLSSPKGTMWCLYDPTLTDWERTRPCLFQFFLCDQASNWLECLPVGSISTWEDLTTRFLAQFFPQRRTTKLRNDILMFQQHQGESLSEAWTRFMDLPQKSLIMASIFGSKSKSFMTMSISPQVLFARSYPMKDPQSSSNPFNSVNEIKTYFKSTNTFQKDQPQVNFLTVNEIETPKPKEPKKALEDEFHDLHLNLAVLEVLAHAPIYALLDKYVESLELGKNGFAFIQGEMPKKMKDPGLFTLPCRLGDSKPFDTLADLGSWLANGTKSYPVGIVNRGRGFLATASAVIDCRKAKIAIGEGITRSIFGVKEIGLGHVDTTYWTTLAKRKSYESRPSTNIIGVRPPYYLEKDL
nr:zinc finger, CCHC-type [Tanacetum cinerariifolium]